MIYQTQSPNSEIAIKVTIKIIKPLPDFEITKSVCCIEHTGIYNAHLLAYLHKLPFPVWGGRPLGLQFTVYSYLLAP